MGWRDRIDPALRKMSRRVPNVTFGPFVTRGFRLLMKVAPMGATPGVETRTVELGDQRVVVFTPTAGLKAPAALMWIHGGGRIVGVPEMDGWTCARLALELGVVVVAASYGLAPERPFPAGLDDCHAAWSWLVAHAGELGIDPERIALGGESAGGGIAAELTQRLVDEGGVSPRAQLLVYPMLDDRTAIDPELPKDHLVWNNRSNLYAWTCYLGHAPGEKEPPPYAVAARREDLGGLPPAWFTIGELDLFLGENRAYAARLEEAGVRVTMEFVPGAFHGFYASGRYEAPIVAVHESMDRFLTEELGLDPHVVVGA